MHHCHARLGGNEARLRAEGQVLRGMESPRGIGQLRDFASVFDVALSRQPAEIARAQAEGKQAIISIAKSHGSRRYWSRSRGLSELLEGGPNPGASCPASKSTVNFASFAIIRSLLPPQNSLVAARQTAVCSSSAAFARHGIVSIQPNISDLSSNLTEVQ